MTDANSSLVIHLLRDQLLQMLVGVLLDHAEIELHEAVIEQPVGQPFHFNGGSAMRLILGGLFAATLVFSLAIPSSAGDDFKPEPGYVSLFNGKDLEGWKYYKETDLKGKTETADKRFRVADGVIIA